MEIHSYRIQFEGDYYFVSTAIDISQRKQDEADLEAVNRRLTESDSVLRATFESTRDGILVVDENGKVSHFNQRFSDIWSIPPDLLASGEDERLLTHVLPQLADPEAFTCSVGEIYRSSGQSEDKLRFKDGRIIERCSYPLMMEGRKTGRVWFFRDVTEKSRLEEMMIQSEKMLSVGGLAAGMAHEINNPLAGIMQTAGVLANRLGDTAKIPANQKAAEAAGTTITAIDAYMRARGIPKMLDTIKTSGRRVAETVSNMLSFARKSEAAVSTHRMDELIDKTLILAETDYDLKKHYDFKQIHIVKQYADDLPGVPCEGAKIQQVLLNVLRNGAQAMNAAATPTPRFTLRTRLDATREMVAIEIADNGPGMDDDVRKRVFEPFFTTKPEGTGTGLGLSVSYFIVTENHGGEMTVESIPGSGTTFIVRLPVNGVQ